MAASGRKTRVSFTPARRTQQAAFDRRTSIIWIKKLVNKQVEKRMAAMCSDLLLMNRFLREEMEAELQHLTRLVMEGARERSIHYTRLYPDYRIEYDESTDEDEDVRKWKQDGSLRILVAPSSSSDSSDSFISDTETSDVSSDAQSKKNCSFSLAATPVSNNSQFMTESAEERSSSPHWYMNSSFTEEDMERFSRVRTKDEEALGTVEGKRGQAGKRRNKVKPADKVKTEEQGGATPPVSEKKKKQTMKAVKKMRTYVRDLFNPHAFSRWERLEDED